MQDSNVKPVKKSKTTTEAEVKTVMKPQVTVEEQTGRIFRGSQSVHIDNFKLMVASDVHNYAPKQVGDKTPFGQVEDFEPQYVTREHVHFFHTYDSNGKKQSRSTSIAGHFHEIKVIPQGPGLPPKIEVGPAVKEVRKKDPRTKKFIVALAPADDDKLTVEECHVHKWEYLWSEQTVVRDMNMKALRLEQQEAEKQTGPAGVVG